MKKRMSREGTLIRGPHPLDRSAATGSHCPAAGWWMPQGESGHGRLFAEGAVMPDHEGRPVIWAFVGRDT